MKKYLAIDYGSKKIGVAVSDAEGKFAFPFSIILNKNKDKSLEEIIQILKEKQIKDVVVGESVNLRGEANSILEESKIFVKKLQEKIDIEIFFEKEWLSTVEARRFDDRKNADDSAAAIILQRFLDKKNRV
ncbi:MAG TPA: Holliday junction resolvase RuvX [Candidatus Paceibacterota bacterium]|nr:Holliday junction resolvase RuvX [Candidatus Paceibacterota bacterium]HQB56942.1 Holliday junction resolvase RuvX [Candidatus Paceibacterota bacterium]